MEDQRVISFERGRQLADQLGVEFFDEVSNILWPADPDLHGVYQMRGKRNPQVQKRAKRKQLENTTFSSFRIPSNLSVALRVVGL